MSLLKNAAFNLMGAAVPAVLAIVTVPFTVRMMGAEDYGLLMLITAIVGYFAVLDINVTAGSTRYVSHFHAAGDAHALNMTVSFGLLVYAGIGLAGMAGLLAFARPLVTHVFSVTEPNQVRAIAAVHVAAIGFATGQLQSYLQSLPGALLRYDVAARIEASFGVALPLATVALLAAGYGLIELIWLRVGMSVLQSALVLAAVRRLLPQLRWAAPDAATRRAMVSFSAYAFLSRLASLTYSQADRLIIGARLSVAALTYYAVPANMANRVMGLVFRLAQVMFPHASALAAQGRLDELEDDYYLASRYVFFLNGALAVMLAVLARPLLTVWMGADFAAQGTLILALIALTQWVDSLTNLPSLVNDGLGHPQVTGSFAITRAILGLALVAAGVHWAGLYGAALAHLAGSLLVGLAFLVYVHGRTVPFPLGTLIARAYARPAAALVAPTLAGLAIVRAGAPGWPAFLGGGVVMSTALAVSAYAFVLTPAHRQALAATVRRAIGPGTSA
jgi:O-antigen/teichoic acid export membrane protein